jgi:hypothetical protein
MISSTQITSATRKRYSPLKGRGVEMKLNKTEKLQKIQDEVEDFIATHELKTHHYLSDKEIITEFSIYKKKHVREAINNLR